MLPVWLFIGEQRNTAAVHSQNTNKPLLAAQGHSKNNSNMKKTILIAMMAFVSCLYVCAQSQSLEPEYVGQVAVVNADSTTTLLDKETTTLKSKSSKWGFVPVAGSSLLDKSKMNIVENVLHRRRS